MSATTWIINILLFVVVPGYLTQKFIPIRDKRVYFIFGIFVALQMLIAYILSVAGNPGFLPDFNSVVNIGGLLG